MRIRDIIGISQLFAYSNKYCYKLDMLLGQAFENVETFTGKKPLYFLISEQEMHDYKIRNNLIIESFAIESKYFGKYFVKSSAYLIPQYNYIFRYGHFEILLEVGVKKCPKKYKYYIKNFEMRKYGSA